jgi:hypothetical protein
VILDKVGEIPRYELHHFRKDKSPNSPQKIRISDNARGWRLVLQKYGAGWRLQYWQIPTPHGSVIEFANVSKESVREIL